jgi:hypothetical protein
MLGDGGHRPRRSHARETATQTGTANGEKRRRRRGKRRRRKRRRRRGGGGAAARERAAQRNATRRCLHTTDDDEKIGEVTTMFEHNINYCFVSVTSECLHTLFIKRSVHFRSVNFVLPVDLSCVSAAVYRNVLESRTRALGKLRLGLDSASAKRLRIVPNPDKSHVLFVLT